MLPKFGWHLIHCWVRCFSYFSITKMPGIARDTKQRGATLITSHKDSSIDIKQIPLTTIEKNYK